METEDEAKVVAEAAAVAGTAVAEPAVAGAGALEAAGMAPAGEEEPDTEPPRPFTTDSLRDEWAQIVATWLGR